MRTADGRERGFGRDRERTVGYLGLAVLVLVAGLALLYWHGRTGPRGVPWKPLGVDPVWLVAAVGIGLAAVPGSLEDGLLAGWVLGSAPFVSRALGPAVVPTMAFDEPMLVVVATTLLFGIVVGGVGFVIGAGVRWVRAFERSTEASRP